MSSLRVALSIVVASSVALTGLVLEDITPASACGNVRYKSYRPKSELRTNVESALAAKDWAKALVILKGIENPLTGARWPRIGKDPSARGRRGSINWPYESHYYFQLATAFYHSKDLASAARAIGRATIKASDHRHRAQCNLLYGNILLKQGLYRKAVKRLERAKKHAAKDYKVHSTLGTAQEKLGNYEAAEAALAKAVVLNPKAHQGLEWAHLEVVRYRIQLAKDPASASTSPFLHAFAKSKSAAALAKARRFAKTIAPDLELD